MEKMNRREIPVIEIEKHPDFDNHEAVEMVANETLTAIIAVHNSNLGPAAGGCRMYPYDSEWDALTDVLRLSRGMTYKSALAGLPLGGGKSVIIANPATDKSPELFHAMGDFVNSLKGRYVTAEDSGTSVEDMALIGERTPYVSGVMAGDRFGGDPSPWTAYGVYTGIREAVKYRCGTDLRDIRVAIQGVGNVGFHLARLLTEAGASVVVADVNERNLDRAVAELGVEFTDIGRILSTDADVLAPCALGGAINRESIRTIRAGIVAGAANNQLADSEVGGDLLDLGILYCPDYVINAGGIIDVYYQQQGNHSEAVVKAHVEKIGDRLSEIFRQSDLKRMPSNLVADEMAEQIFRKKSGKQAA